MSGRRYWILAFGYYCLLLFSLTTGTANAKIVIPSTGDVYQTEPATFGVTFPWGDDDGSSQLEEPPVQAHLQLLQFNDEGHLDLELSSCTFINKSNNKNHNETSTSTSISEPMEDLLRKFCIVEPSDGIPVALLVENNYTYGRLPKEAAQIASQMYPVVQYMIVRGYKFPTLYDANQTGSNLGILSINEEDGEALIDLILLSHQSSSSSGLNDGPIIQMDGSLPTKYIQQRKVLAIVPKISSFLSALGSSCIVLTLIFGSGGNYGGRGDGSSNINITPQLQLRRKQHALHLTFNRLLLALSVVDILSSSATFFTTWAIPSTSDGAMKQYLWDIEFPYASGNDATCTAQGFFIQFGFLSSCLIMMFISIQFVLVVKYRWHVERMRKAEVVFFVIGVVFPLGSAIVMASLDVFNTTGTQFCWIHQSPFLCWGWGHDTEEGSACSGKEADPTYIHNLQLYGGFLWIVIATIITIISMSVLYCEVRNRERRTARWSDEQNMLFCLFDLLRVYCNVNSR